MHIEELLDRYEQPAHRGGLQSPPALRATSTNPRCGDVVTMFALVDRDRLVRVTFEGAGCTISQAAADVVAELAEGQSIARVKALELQSVIDYLGAGVIRTRRDCASLALRTLQRALG